VIEGRPIYKYIYIYIYYKIVHKVQKLCVVNIYAKQHPTSKEEKEEEKLQSLRRTQKNQK